MPRMYDAEGRTEDLTSAMIGIIDREGVRALSLRRTCREINISPASALNHYGGWARLQSLGALFTWEWRQRSRRARLREDGVAGLVPDGHEELAEARAWLGWQEIGRSNTSIGEVVSGVRDDELALLARATNNALDSAALLLLHAALEGLVAARCALVDPMTASEARQLLGRLVSALRTPGLVSPDA